MFFKTLFAAAVICGWAVADPALAQLPQTLTCQWYASAHLCDGSQRRESPLRSGHQSFRFKFRLDFDAKTFCVLEGDACRGALPLEVIYSDMRTHAVWISIFHGYEISRIDLRSGEMLSTSWNIEKNEVSVIGGKCERS